MRASTTSVVLGIVLVAAASVHAQVTPCGPGLCFSGQFNDNALLQRAPARAALYGTLAPADAPLSLTLAGTADDGTAFNKTFVATTSGITWKVILDAMPTGGTYSAALACPTCTGDVVAPLVNLTFGDIFYCTVRAIMQCYNLATWTTMRVLRARFSLRGRMGTRCVERLTTSHPPRPHAGPKQCVAASVVHVCAQPE